MPLPLTPVTQVSVPSGIRTSICFRLCSAAPLTVSQPVGFRRFFGVSLKRMYGPELWAAKRLGWIREHDGEYELNVDLPGFKKDQIQLHLENGYLTITAAKSLDEDSKDKNGRIVHQERYTGSMTRSYYVGEHVTEEDVKARFEDGVLTLCFPKQEPRKLPESRTIQIEG